MTRAIESAAPSTIAILHECPYRIALRQGAAKSQRSTPWARLGTASHEVLASAIVGGLGSGENTFDKRFETAWEKAIGVEAAKAEAHPGERMWGRPLRWPTYADRMLRTRRLALDLAQQQASWASPDVIVESRLRSTDGRIFGTPDVVVRNPSPHRVEDFKTGGILDDEGVLRERYRRQIVLYAYLEYEASGSLPGLGVVRRLRGPAIEFDISSKDIEAERGAAIAAIDSFNAALSDAEGLAQPSTTTCRACPYTGRCEPFWRMIEGAAPAELTAVGGVVTAVHATDGHGIAVHVVRDEGNAAVPEAAVRGIATPLAPWLSASVIGSRVRIVGVAPVGGTEASFAPRGMLRVDQVQ